MKTATEETDTTPGAAPVHLDDVEAALAHVRREEAATLLSAIERPRSSDLDSLRRLMRAASELGRSELAAACAGAARAAHGDGEAVRLLHAEERALSGDFDGAAEALEAVPAKPHGENVVAPALRELLRAMRWSAADDPPPLPEIEPQLVWFEPVATMLAFEIERRLTALPASPEKHAARSALIRPDLRPEVFSKPRTSVSERLFGWTRDAARRDYDRREREVDEMLYAGDLDGAAALIESWLETDVSVFEDPADVRIYFLAALRFAGDRFDEVADLGLRLKGDVTTAGPDLISLLAYTAIARGELDSAATLVHSCIAGSRSAPIELTHLAAVIELESADSIERGASRAMPWLRRAFQSNDIALVELMRGERELLAPERRAESRS